MTISSQSTNSSDGDGTAASSGIPLEESKAICLALTSQLLNKETQFKVAKDSMNSAYMLDHLYYLSLFKDFEGF